MAMYPAMCFVAVLIFSLLTHSLTKASSRNFQTVNGIRHHDKECCSHYEKEMAPVGRKEVNAVVHFPCTVCIPEECPSETDPCACVPCPPNKSSKKAVVESEEVFGPSVCLPEDCPSETDPDVCVPCIPPEKSSKKAAVEPDQVFGASKVKAVVHFPCTYCIPEECISETDPCACVPCPPKKSSKKTVLEQEEVFGASKLDIDP